MPTWRSTAPRTKAATAPASTTPRWTPTCSSASCRERSARGDRENEFARRLSADRQQQRRERGRRRGALPLDASAARRDSARRLHPDRGEQRADHRARRMGAAPRLSRGNAWPGLDGRRQRLAAAVPPRRLRRRGGAHPGRDRVRSRRGSSSRSPRARCLAMSTTAEIAMFRLKALGVRLRARRFRHRLFEPALSAPFPVRQAQDRPQLRALDRDARRMPPRSCTPSSASAAASA